MARSEARSLMNGLRFATRMGELVSDLRLLVLRNGTDVPFIMGDTPCLQQPLSSRRRRRGRSRSVIAGAHDYSADFDSRTAVLLLDKAVYRAARFENDWRRHGGSWRCGRTERARGSRSARLPLLRPLERPRVRAGHPSCPSAAGRLAACWLRSLATLLNSRRMGLGRRSFTLSSRSSPSRSTSPSSALETCLPTENLKGPRRPKGRRQSC